MSDNRKRLYDLKKDEELKVASWHAARGAARGAAGVRLPPLHPRRYSFLFLSPFPFPPHSNPCLGSRARQLQALGDIHIRQLAGGTNLSAEAERVRDRE